MRCLRVADLEHACNHRTDRTWFGLGDSAQHHRHNQVPRLQAFMMMPAPKLDEIREKEVIPMPLMIMPFRDERTSQTPHRDVIRGWTGFSVGNGSTTSDTPLHHPCIAPRPHRFGWAAYAAQDALARPSTSCLLVLQRCIHPRRCIHHHRDTSERGGNSESESNDSHPDVRQGGVCDTSYRISSCETGVVRDPASDIRWISSVQTSPGNHGSDLLPFCIKLVPAILRLPTLGSGHGKALHTSEHHSHPDWHAPARSI